MRAADNRPGKPEGEAAERLAGRYPRADRGIAGAAPAALGQVADHRNQLVGAQPVATGPTMGRRPEQGFTSGQAVQRQLEEAAQRHTKRKQEGCTQQVAHDVKQSMAPPGQQADPHSMIIDAYLQILLDQLASDLILSTGAPPTMRQSCPIEGTSTNFARLQPSARRDT